MVLYLHRWSATHDLIMTAVHDFGYTVHHAYKYHVHSSRCERRQMKDDACLSWCMYSSCTQHACTGLVFQSVGMRYLIVVRLSPTIIIQNTRPICPLVALQVKDYIPIFSLLQQQDLKDNTLCKWVSRREDTQIWVMPLLIPKMGLLYGYSVEGYRYCVGDPF